MTPTRDERRRPAVLHVVLGAAAVLVAANFAYSVLQASAPPLAAPVAVAPVAPSPVEEAEAEPVTPVVPIDFTGGRDSQSIRD